MNWIEMKVRSPVSFILTIIFVQLLKPSNQAHHCVGLNGNTIPCPYRSNSTEKNIQAYIKECKGLKANPSKEEKTSCSLFPIIVDPNGSKLSCYEHAELHNQSRTTCTHGYVIQSTRQKRGVGPTGLVYVSIKFFGLIQPVPKLMSIQEAYESKKKDKEKYCFGNEEYDNTTAYRPIANEAAFDVTEWLSLGLSKDREMGDDLIIHCNPFMDKMARKCGHKFTTIDEKFYPDEIGIGINKYYTFTEGKQAYEAERIFGAQRGNIVNGRVQYTPSATNNSFGILECSVDISTFILLQSRAEITTGIEIDMEKQTRAFVFLATGPCLVQDCLGNVEENELREVARRTTVLSKHRKIHISMTEEVLFDQGDSSGAQTIVLNYVTVAFLFYLCWIAHPIV